jgi:ribosome-binding protein aMBF1 (putative translation factor)
VILRQYTANEIRKAMIDAGYPSYASLARKLGRTSNAVINVIKNQQVIPSKSLEKAIVNELKVHLPKKPSHTAK